MKQTTRIPKIVHYCWFGGVPLSELAEKCIASWKQYCPDYQIMRWDESTFDVNSNAYAREAYTAGKWAFVADVARLSALVSHGGFYLDTDVELIKPLDTLLEYEALLGFESPTHIAGGVMACEKGHRMFRIFLDDYKHAHFLREDGSLDLTTNVSRITEHCRELGLKLNNQLQTINGMTIFPSEFFSPKNMNTNETAITSNTYDIHHFEGSWLPDEIKFQIKIRSSFPKVVPFKIANCISGFIAATKHRGLRFAIRKTLDWLRK